MQYAHDAARKLEARLALVRIALPAGAPVPGLELRLDGVVMPSVATSGVHALEPGRHTLVATAPGRKRWSLAIDAAVGQIVAADVVVEEEAPLREAPVHDHPRPDDDRGMPTQKLVGLVLGGAGLVGIGVGAVFAVVAKLKLDDAKTACSPGTYPVCDDRSRDAVTSANQSADGAATTSTVFFVAGGVALAGGAVLFFTAPRAAVRAYVTPRIGGVALGGAW